METFTAIAKVRWYFDEALHEEYIAISNVRTFTEAMQRIENVYGEDLDSATVDLIDNDFCPLTEEIYNALLKGEIM